MDNAFNGILRLVLSLHYTQVRIKLHLLFDIIE